jgi:hypothetical protein
MSAKFSILTVAAIPLLPAIPLLACGGDDGPSVTVVDAAVDGRPIDAAAACTAAASNPTPSFGSNQSAERSGSGSATVINYVGRLNADTMPDLLAIDLYAGYGAFQSGTIAPATINLTGVEADYATCGACVLILTDLHQQGSGAALTDIYLANGGTMNLTGAGSSLQATLSNVTFRQVMIGSGGTTTNVGNCTSSLASATISTPIVAGSATFTGGIENGRLVLRHRRY